MALRRITLRDFVIVQTLELDLSPGFTVLTGETGAGKSILIDALQLILGSRADAGVVREGAARGADLKAPSSTVRPMHTRGWRKPASGAGELLLLRRTVDTQGKSRAWVNGTPATATQLRTLGDLLLDIHGQHAWQSLTRPDSVRELLDAYAGVRATDTSEKWNQWRVDQKALQQARQDQATLQQERERLRWQIGEVDKLAPPRANGTSWTPSTSGCRMRRRCWTVRKARSRRCRTTMRVRWRGSRARTRCCKARRNIEPEFCRPRRHPGIQPRASQRCRPFAAAVSAPRRDRPPAFGPAGRPHLRLDDPGTPVPPHPGGTAVAAARLEGRNAPAGCRDGPEPAGSRRGRQRQGLPNIRRALC